jgi:crotonobetainyl-CoA:carnitine CoA-transferase CaiB-like acyl-CoA transferase
MAGVLDGLRVLDFGRYIAGPFCAALLADLGADVIRVEKVRGSEDRFVIPLNEAGDGAMFTQVNRNKRGLTLNPMKPDGRVVVRKLAATADIVVANLPDSALEAMALDYASLSAVKPDIILTTVSAFGTGGPYSDKLGFDGIGQAMSGSMYLSGQPGQPTKSYVPWVDYTTALSATVGTLAAVMAHRQTGQGQQVKGSLLASALTIANPTLIEQAVNAPDRVASWNRSQVSAPSDAHQTRDGWILVQTIGRPLFERWTSLIGEPHWLEDPRFIDDMSRGDHGEAISERMTAWCAERTTDQALAELEAARIPAGPVYSRQPRCRSQTPLSR